MIKYEFVILETNVQKRLPGCTIKSGDESLTTMIASEKAAKKVQEFMIVFLVIFFLHTRINTSIINIVETVEVEEGVTTKVATTMAMIRKHKLDRATRLKHHVGFKEICMVP